MAIDIFSTGTLLKAVETLPKAPAWLRDTFFSRTETFETDFIMYDVKKGRRELAQFCAPGMGSISERDGYDSFRIVPPSVYHGLITTAEDALRRLPGENMFAAKSPMERAAQILNDDLETCDQRITEREEWMCAQALLTGGISIQGDGVHDEALFWNTRNGGAGDPFTALSGTSLWDAGSTCDPLKDLNDAVENIMQESGVNPTMAVMGKDAIEAFINSDKVQQWLDNRRIDFGNMAWPAHLADGQHGGVRYYGNVAGLDIFCYIGKQYINGVSTDIFDSKKVLIGSPKADTLMAYGAVGLFGEGTDAPRIYAAPRVPDSYCQRKKPAGRIVEIHSRPLPVIQRKNCFQVLQVLS